jgi:hypothetical protein
MHFITTLNTTSPTLSDCLWFKLQQCLACRMLLLWEETDCSDQLKMDISINLQFIIVAKKSLLQNDGYLPLFSYYANQSNKRLCSFLSSPTDCIWTHLPQHPNKHALPQNVNIIISPELRKYSDVQSAPNFLAHSLNLQQNLFKKRLNLENENQSVK